MNHQFEITELNRRVANLLRIGTVDSVDLTSVIPTCRVKIGQILTGWLPMLTFRASQDRTWWVYEVGEQVCVFSTCGDLSQGVVLGSINQNNHPAPANQNHVHRTVYADGAIIEYDRNAHHLKAQLPSGATTLLFSDGGVSIIGDVFVTGNITASGDITDHTRSMQADREIYNSHTHKSPESGAPTTPPLEQQ